MHALEQKQLAMGGDVMTLKLSMDSNTEALREYIELSKHLKVGLKFLTYVEKTAKWFTTIAVAGATAWAMWKYIILATINEAVKK